MLRLYWPHEKPPSIFDGAWAFCRRQAAAADSGSQQSHEKNTNTGTGGAGRIGAAAVIAHPPVLPVVALLAS